MSGQRRRNAQWERKKPACSVYYIRRLQKCLVSWIQRHSTFQEINVCGEAQRVWPSRKHDPPGVLCFAIIQSCVLKWRCNIVSAGQITRDLTYFTRLINANKSTYCRPRVMCAGCQHLSHWQNGTMDRGYRIPFFWWLLWIYQSEDTSALLSQYKEPCSLSISSKMSISVRQWRSTSLRMENFCVRKSCTRRTSKHRQTGANGT